MTKIETPGAALDMRSLTGAEFEAIAGGLNPQPLPPLGIFRRDWVMLNPQPLPPRWNLSGLFRFW